MNVGENAQRTLFSMFVCKKKGTIGHNQYMVHQLQKSNGPNLEFPDEVEIQGPWHFLAALLVCAPPEKESPPSGRESTDFKEQSNKREQHS